jgi:hypothetical protein
MSHFDDIYEIAADNYGVVTYAQAHEAGVEGVELSRWVASGRLERVGHGVYRLARWVPTGRERYAEALALVGPDAVLWGESVLALLGLAYVNPGAVYIAPGRRVRRELPAWVRLASAPVTRRAAYEGIACQELGEAILACRGRVLTERLRDAADEAGREGYITKGEHKALREELA